MLILVRGPCEIRGFFSIVTVLISMAGSFVSAWLYSNHYEEDDKLDTETLQTVLSVLTAFWITSAASFVACMNRSYLHTFYSLDTTSDYKRKCFLSAGEGQDDLKSKILKDHPDDRWEEEKHSWFTDKWIEQVPNNYIPYDWRVKYNKTKGRVDDPQMRRRSSLQQVKMLMGGEEEK
ncbi:hypothetical protein TrVE_jg6934 [Triparma verrucosa]|uniref:Uncharacterized protein n=1 Tax=Triparma verrucosa TaxID=1606542 RepID=A0A9W7CBG2_9STRA|nr:hypothetical protein TrVE_jg6934 [Triparma verrucosa]